MDKADVERTPSAAENMPIRRNRASLWVLAALFVGLLLGALMANAGDGLRDPAVRFASTVGGLWLDALKMTVVPLIIALLVTGIVGGADAARAGGVAGRSFAWFVAVLTGSGDLRCAGDDCLAQPVSLARRSRGRAPRRTGRGRRQCRQRRRCRRSTTSSRASSRPTRSPRRPTTRSCRWSSSPRYSPSP